MTYKSPVPQKVFDRWTKLNPNYTIDFSMDADCIRFLTEHFGESVADLFRTIPKGMYKADLWRLCKLYIHGGIYADVDLVPHEPMVLDQLIDPKADFYSVLDIGNAAIFQAFMAAKPRSPLVLAFLSSFLINHPYNYPNGPTYDMKLCIQHMVDYQTCRPTTLKPIQPNEFIPIADIFIIVPIGSSNQQCKRIPLLYVNSEVTYSFELMPNPYVDRFQFVLDRDDKSLVITRLDESHGWGFNHFVKIRIVPTTVATAPAPVQTQPHKQAQTHTPNKSNVYLFKEQIGATGWVTSYVTHKGVKIMDSRDLEYHANGGW